MDQYATIFSLLLNKNKGIHTNFGVKIQIDCCKKLWFLWTKKQMDQCAIIFPFFSKNTRKNEHPWFFTPFFQPNWFHYIFDRFMRLVSPKKIGLYSTAPYSIFSWWWWWCSPIFDYMRDMSHVSKHQWHRNQLAPAIEHPSRLNRRLERVQKTVVELEGERISGFYTIVERTGATHPKKPALKKTILSTRYPYLWSEMT